MKTDVVWPIPPLELMLTDDMEFNSSEILENPSCRILSDVKISNDAGDECISMGLIVAPTTIGFSDSLA